MKESILQKSFFSLLFFFFGVLGPLRTILPTVCLDICIIFAVSVIGPAPSLCSLTYTFCKSISESQVFDR